MLTPVDPERGPIRQWRAASGSPQFPVQLMRPAGVAAITTATEKRKKCPQHLAYCAQALIFHRVSLEKLRRHQSRLLGLASNRRIPPRVFPVPRVNPITRTPDSLL